MESRGIGVAVVVITIVVVIAVVAVAVIAIRSQSSQTSTPTPSPTPTPTPSPILSVVKAQMDFSKSISHPDLWIELLNQGNGSATITSAFINQPGSGAGYYSVNGGSVTVNPTSTAWVDITLDYNPPTPGFINYTGPMACQLKDSSGNVLYSTSDLNYGS